MKGPILRCESDRGVAILRLHRGVTNALVPELVDELRAALRDLAGDPELRGVVLCGSNDKFFSIGFDIPRVLELSREAFAGFFGAFNDLCLDLYSFPKPTAAALSGHAVAGGCILALCCDHRILARGRKSVGMNAVKLGVAVPFLAGAIILERLGNEAAGIVLGFGDFYDPEAALRMGIATELCPAGEVLRRAVEVVRCDGPKSVTAPEAISATETSPDAVSARLHATGRVPRAETMRARYAATREETDRAFLENWYSEETQALLRGAVDRF
jgi:Delta3-Delta2-enoyl-CoA isomerase